MVDVNNTIEENPFRPSVPDSVRSLSLHLYDYLSEQAPLLRETYWMTLKASKALDSKIEETASTVEGRLIERIESIDFDFGPIQGEIDFVKLTVDKIGSEYKVRFDSVDAQFKANTENAERMIRMVSEKVAVINPDKIMGMFNERLDLTAQYQNLAGTAAGNAIGAAQDTWVNLKATEEFKRLAEVKADEAGFHVSSAAILRSEAAISSNLSKASASAAAVSEQNAQVHMTNAGISAQSALTHKTNAETAAGNAATQAGNASQSAGQASTSAGQASQSATNAAGSASTASGHATTATNAATTATGKAGEASTHAGTASTKASQASQSASDAAAQASNASSSATTATGAATTAGTHASNASTSASQASTSASNAAGSAATATTQASIAVSAVAEISPSRITSLDHYSGSSVVSPAAPTSTSPPQGVLVTGDADFGTAIEWTSTGTGNRSDYVPRTVYPVQPGIKYEFVVRLKQTVGPIGLAGSHVATRYLSATYGSTGAPATGSINGLDALNKVVEVRYIVDCDAIIATSPTTKFVRPNLILTGQAAGNTFRVGAIYARDVSARESASAASVTATQQASAAAGSASTASTQASNAATQANNASTHAGNAQTSANTATTQAASATSSATLAASVATGALNKNSTFHDWPGGNQTLPTHWLEAGSGMGTIFQKAGPNAGSFGSNYHIYHFAAAGQNWGIHQVISQLGPGVYALECKIEHINGLFGAGLYIDFMDINNNPVGFGKLHLADATPVGGKVGPHRVYSKPVIAPLGTAWADLYMFTNSPLYFGVDQQKVIRWHRAALVTLSASEAAVINDAGAVVDVKGRTRAWLNSTVSANGASAAVRLTAGEEGGVATSDIDLISGKITLRSNADGIERKALEVVGSSINLYGDLNAGGSIRVGTRRIPIALQSFTLEAGDGEPIDFGTDLINIPNVVLGSQGLAPLAAGQTYDLRVLNLTSTGGTMYAKIITPASTVAVAAVAGVNTGGSPAWRAHKGAVGDSANGNYKFTVGMSVTCYSPAVGEPYEGSYGFEMYVRVAGQATWTSIGEFSDILAPGNRGASDPASKVVGKTVAVTGYFGGVIGQDADYEFGIVATASTIASFPGVSYTAQGSSGSASSATPSGQKVAVTIIPKNQ